MALTVESRSDDQRVVITGVEAITPLGLNLQESVKALREGKSGIVNLTEALGHRLIDNDFLEKEKVDVGAVIVGFQPERYFPSTELRKVHRSAQIMYVAAVGALVDAEVLRETPPPFKGNAEDFIASMFPDAKGKPPADPTLAERFGVTSESQSLLVNVDPHKAGIDFGTGVGGSTASADIEDTLIYHRMKRILKGLLEEKELEAKIEEVLSGEGRELSKSKSPYWILQVLPDRILDVFSNRIGFRGPGRVTVTACSSALEAMGEAYEDIIRGNAILMATGGAEAAMERIGYSAFATMRALNFTEDPLEASIPFYGGEGFVMAEGAGAFVFELRSHALARGARMYGEVLGHATRLDGHHDTAPRSGGEGAVIAMNLALEQAGVEPEEVDYVNAHGTSTPLGDSAELLALTQVFGAEKVRIMPVFSGKGFHGHTLGASGAMETALAFGQARERFLSANWNPTGREPILDGVELLMRSKKDFITRIFMKNSFGFGGKNTSMLFAIYS